jgi:hypothetical protein
MEHESDARPLTLELDESSLQVRDVLQVEFKTNDLPVRVEHGQQFFPGEGPF